MMKRFNLVATAVMAGTLFSALPAHSGSTSLYAGVDKNPSAATLYAGAVVAFNGDLSKNGYLVRINASGTNYDYDTTAIPQGVSGSAKRLEVGIGHQWIEKHSRVSFYIGGDHQVHDLSPDDTANLSRGTENGLAVQLEASNDNSPYDLSMIASYSNSNDTYFTRVRGGSSMGSNTVGLEGALSGSESYAEKRIGAYLSVPYGGHTAINFSLGKSDSEGKNSIQNTEGLYLQLGISDQF